MPTLFPGVYDDYNNTHTGVAYGFALIVPDLNEDYYIYYDLGYNFYYNYNSLEDYEGMYGVYQIHQDGPEPDPEAGGDSSTCQERISQQTFCGIHYQK